VLIFFFKKRTLRRYSSKQQPHTGGKARAQGMKTSMV